MEVLKHHHRDHCKDCILAFVLVHALSRREQRSPTSRNRATQPPEKDGARVGGDGDGRLRAFTRRGAWKGRATTTTRPHAFQGQHLHSHSPRQHGGHARPETVHGRRCVLPASLRLRSLWLFYRLTSSSWNQSLPRFSRVSLTRTMGPHPRSKGRHSLTVSLPSCKNLCLR